MLQEPPHPVLSPATPSAITNPRSVFQDQDGNVVDAMALVSRRAWRAVGGYTHLEGGWEDYDFWCKLVADGWHGVQCPQLLALYRSHTDAMTFCDTARRQRALSRTLQKRHPWLRLPLAG